MPTLLIKNAHAIATFSNDGDEGIEYLAVFHVPRQVILPSGVFKQDHATDC